MTTAFLFGAAPAQAAERYYMLVFAYQGPPPLAHSSHTFATFVHARTTAGGGEKLVDKKTISWLPASLNVRVLRGLPEPGRNLSLKETLALAKKLNAEVSLWGPYQIKKELYDRAVKQCKLLDRGAIAYKALDVNFRPDVASNCVHAVCDLDADKGLLLTGTAFGNNASAMVAQHLRRWVDDAKANPNWLLARLGLKKSDIEIQAE